ncbi:hypothetical protein M407DRAFT_208943 [Tulasnella calospora MUT 4182]|uniref:Uncharacterized protein n=1 Tax=Tulasnella calospora MUT 4182 TaxID=1051891 RepID=A0A0C3QGQ1_9AGAM|nr:hypothetical protein M407DRAFT_208943 [Tulasnella calospora MUT 4182]
MPSSSSSRSQSPVSESTQSSDPPTPSPADQGSASNWKPPRGYVKVNVGSPEQGKTFDFDTIKNDPNLEIWVMRMPLSIKPKHLENLTIQMPADPSSSSAQSIGSINRKGKHYDIQLLPPQSDAGPPTGDHPVTETGGLGEAGELKSLSVLLPRSKTNSLVLAPRPPTRHVLVTQAAPFPTPTPPDHQLYTGPPAPRPQPLEKLVHAFRPIGSLAPAQPPFKQPEAFPMDIGKHQDGSEDVAEERPKKKRRKDGAGSEARPEKTHSAKKKKHAQKAD